VARSPMAVYEVHLGSWPRPGRRQPLSDISRTGAPSVPYVKETGFTHIELMPVMEHPFSGSGATRCSGSSRDEPLRAAGGLQVLRRRLSPCGARVILDWVPGHFPRTATASRSSTARRSSSTRTRGRAKHQDWGTLIFNLRPQRGENFLLSNALFWLEEYHVDACASTRSRRCSYLELLAPRRRVDSEPFRRTREPRSHHVHAGAEHPHPPRPSRHDHGAEESTAYAASAGRFTGRPRIHVQVNMGWMHESSSTRTKSRPRRGTTTSSRFRCCTRSPRTSSCRSPTTKWFTARAPSSTNCGRHVAEVRDAPHAVRLHVRASGQEAALHGREFGQWREWNHDRSLTAPARRSVPWRPSPVLQDLNGHYHAEPSLYECDFRLDGFRWIDCNDNENSVVSIVRYARDRHDYLSWPSTSRRARAGYRIGVPSRASIPRSQQRFVGLRRRRLGNGGGCGPASRVHGFDQSVSLTVPPLACLYLKRRAELTRAPLSPIPVTPVYNYVPKTHKTGVKNS